MGKTIQDLLLLGDPRLYQRSDPVEPDEMAHVGEWVADLRWVVGEVRQKYGFGRGIAAPQLGIMKRLVYLELAHPLVLINPELSEPSAEQFELWDDCMCFPHLLVRVERHRSVFLKYLDEQGILQCCRWENELSELIQHECDHLDGILCTMRAIDEKSFRWRE
jgi:peptide deformylase